MRQEVLRHISCRFSSNLAILPCPGNGFSLLDHRFVWPPVAFFLFLEGFPFFFLFVPTSNELLPPVRDGRVLFLLSPRAQLTRNPFRIYRQGHYFPPHFSLSCFFLWDGLVACVLFYFGFLLDEESTVFCKNQPP